MRAHPEPVSLPHLKPVSLPTQFADLLWVQLSNWRWSWRQLVITGMLAPVASILALGSFVGQDPLNDARHYIASGSLVLGLLFMNQNLVASNFAFMKENRTLAFFASLPLRRSVVVGATWVAFFLLSLPAALVTVIAGWAVLRLRLAPSPLVLLALPLAALPMAAIGALIGSTARSFEESSSLVLVATAAMTGLGPVLIPPSHLPAVLAYLGWVNPAAYAGSALREVLIGPITATLWLDLTALALFTLALFALVERALPWKERRAVPEPAR